MISILNLLNFSITVLYTSVILPGTNGQLVKFYEMEEFEGFLYEAQALDHCTTLPMYARYKSRSISSEKCIMVYDGENCDSRSFKILPTEGKVPDVEGIWFWFGRGASFRLCSIFERGDQFKVDVYKSHFYKDLGVEYNNVCGCVNLPRYLRKSVGSIDNYGTCLQFYSKHDCEYTSHLFNADGGKNSRTENFGGTISSKTVSFKPCDWETIPPSCHAKLIAVAYKFQILSSTGSIPDDVELAAKTIIKNNGTATITREYNVKNSVKNTVEVRHSSSLSKFSSVTLDVGEETDVTAGMEVEAGAFGVKAKASLSVSLKSSFNKRSETSQTSTSGDETVYTNEISKEYVISEKFEIPPCTEYEVSSFVKMLKNMAIPYFVYLRVSGKDGDKQMLAAEIREKVKSLNMTYIGDYDNRTVLAKIDGEMRANLGLEAYTDAHGAAIEDCEFTNGKPQESSTGQLPERDTPETTVKTSAGNNAEPSLKTVNLSILSCFVAGIMDLF